MKKFVNKIDDILVESLSGFGAARVGQAQRGQRIPISSRSPFPRRWPGGGAESRLLRRSWLTPEPSLRPHRSRAAAARHGSDVSAGVGTAAEHYPYPPTGEIGRAHV